MAASVDRNTYERNGYLSGLVAVETSDADGYRRRFDQLEEQEGRDKASIGLLDRHRDVSFVREIATNAVILDSVQALIGADILLLASHFFCKYGPEEQKFVAWHQDVTYWGLEPPQAITAWYAVDDADRDNGCMKVIPGTHREIRAHGNSSRAGNLLSINQEVHVTPDEEASAVDLELRAGEFSLHDGALIHGSLPNRSCRRRCGLTLRYIRPDVRPVAMNSMDRPWRPVLVRGRDSNGHFGMIDAFFDL